MRSERGVALLEVLVALAILAVAGTSLVGLMSEEVRSVARTEERGREIDAANAVLTRLALRDKRGLDQRLGRRAEGAWITRVDRPRPGLYRLSVASDSIPDAELVVTVVQRGVAP